MKRNLILAVVLVVVSWLAMGCGDLFNGEPPPETGRFFIENKSSFVVVLEDDDDDDLFNLIVNEIQPEERAHVRTFVADGIIDPAHAFVKLIATFEDDSGESLTVVIPLDLPPWTPIASTNNDHELELTDELLLNAEAVE